MTKFHWLLALTAPGLLAAHAAAAPQLDGVWQIESPVTQLTTADGQPPPLTPEAQKLYDQRKQERAAGKRAAYDTTLKCKPMGEPRTAYDPEGGPFEILTNPKEVVFGYTWNHMLRFVYLTGKKPDVIGPSYYGTATGAWHGNQLVLDVEGLHDTTLLDQSGLPHSDALRMTETFSLADGGQTLVEKIHFDDPRSFTRPWDAILRFRRLPAGTRLAEDVCEERLHIDIY